MKKNDSKNWKYYLDEYFITRMNNRDELKVVCGVALVPCKVIP